MKKERMPEAAVLMEDGFEEGETVTIVDLLRRAGFHVQTFSFHGSWADGMHHIRIRADERFDPEKIESFDLVVVPGGKPAGPALVNNPEVIRLLQNMDRKGKKIAAMCYGTQVMEKAGLLEGKTATGYTGYEKILKSAHFIREAAVSDGNIITGTGPATPYSFVLKILEVFGMDSSELKERMMVPEL